MHTKLFSLGACVLLMACGAKQAAIDEVQFGLTTAGAIGLSGALAMDAIKGPASSCAVVQTACSSYPCTTGSVNVNLSASCQLPLGGAASGSVTVTGNWSSADSAMLQQTFTNATVAAQSGKALAVANVTRVSASRSGNNITISFSGANATAAASGSAVAAGGSQNWTVVVNTKGTADPSDDVLTVEATSASGGAGIGASARVASIKGAVLDPGCRLNPIAGSADITQVSGFVPTITKIQFHAACDGKAEVDGSTQDLQLLP